MQLANSSETIGKLSEFDDYFKDQDVQCWVATAGKIRLYLFTTIFETAEELRVGYKELRDHVAISFQSKTLIESAERWNLYLLYMAKEEIPQDIKQIIQQDKFSSRKIVCSTGTEEITEEYIKNQIARTILDVDIPQREVQSDKLDELIGSKHPKVAIAVSKLPLMNTRENLDELIAILSDDKN